MFSFIAGLFIQDKHNYQDSHVRQQYGTVCSLLSILCNIVLVVFKLTIGFIVGSIAIQADGLNNLSDVGSNLASLFGFKLANRHPDADHPYGHGRIEYIAGLVISFLIILVGISSLKESILKTIHPEPVVFSYVAVVILIVSIFIKLWMYSFNSATGKKIQSSTLIAAGLDSRNDVLATSATLVSLLLSKVTTLPVDGLIGIVVSVLVIIAGIGVCKDTMDPLLGLAPDKELIKEIEKFILSYDKPLGIHDLMMHDYGPGRMFMTLHVEVNCHDDIMAIHEEIDRIERDIHQKFHILTTIHYDPVDYDNPVVNQYKQMVLYAVKELNENYTIHDFRVVPGRNNTNLIFDVLIPADDHIDHHVLKKEIQNKMPDGFSCVIEIDHSYV